jgi:predicted metal-dependent phosphoesterase TrpH
MPARQPFTALCRQLARGRYAGRADLHLHTTHSDGAYTPGQEEGPVWESGPGPEALGRPHLAELLVRQGQVATVREAFRRYLRDGGPAAVPKKRLPVAEALALVRGAGGVAAWAHPAYDCTRESLAELRGLGLGAVEVEYPDFKRAQARELRAWAHDLGLAVSGGSDCHGPGRRSVGTCTVSAEELERLRQRVR